MREDYGYNPVEGDDVNQTPTLAPRYTAHRDGIVSHFQFLHHFGGPHCNSILLNIMFHAPMGRFQLELIYCFTFIFHSRPM